MISRKDNRQRVKDKQKGIAHTLVMRDTSKKVTYHASLEMDGLILKKSNQSHIHPHGMRNSQQC